MTRSQNIRRAIQSRGGLGSIVIAAIATVLLVVTRCTGGTAERGGSRDQGPGPTTGLQRGAIAPSAAQVMPRLEERVDALVAEHGVPADARDALTKLAGSVAALRQHEAAVVGDRAHREAVAAERRAVSERTREVLASLAPAYRAAMRRHRISVRQLAAWAADHGQ